MQAVADDTTMSNELCIRTTETLGVKNDRK
jgi:hypothetical protein